MSVDYRNPHFEAGEDETRLSHLWAWRARDYGRRAVVWMRLQDDDFAYQMAIRAAHAARKAIGEQ